MPPVQTLIIAFAVVCFLVAAYLRTDVPGKLTAIGLALLTLAVVL